LTALTIQWASYCAVDCSGASPTIRDCIFDSNVGGAVCQYVGGGSPTIEDCQFVNNFMWGAVQIGNGLVARCFFKNNSITDTFGGAIIMFNTRVEECIFLGNTAGLGGGAIDAYGGTVRRCLFTQSDGGPGSAITVNASGLLVED